MSGFTPAFDPTADAGHLTEGSQRCSSKEVLVLQQDLSAWSAIRTVGGLLTRRMNWVPSVFQSEILLLPDRLWASELNWHRVF
jgi:hypothetical protein